VRVSVVRALRKWYVQATVRAVSVAGIFLGILVDPRLGLLTGGALVLDLATYRRRLKPVGEINYDRTPYV
jgi:hypothetical protein